MNGENCADGRVANFVEIGARDKAERQVRRHPVVHARARFDPRALPAVRQVLDEIDQGGLPEAIIRTGILVAKAGGGKRRLAQMEHTRELLAPTGVLRHIDEDQFRQLLHEQTLVVEFEPVQAKRSEATSEEQPRRVEESSKTINWKWEQTELST